MLKKIKIDVFSSTLYFIVTEDIEEEIKRLEKRLKIEIDFDGAVEAFFVSAKKRNYYIVIQKNCLSYNTIGHEIFHATIGILETKYIEDEETKAWLCGYLTEEVFKSIDKEDLKDAS